ncbi:Bax inhibitor-1 family protein [Patulibacter sp. SYSU D01012]|uniref:Bax inhibitor-1 family protein n=1 Tax=Patulibacter sp. SYSU D01012 TaxID=2817381 RepID=UPI001B30AB10|nr:Bax inhibitor-1 family protein [Patulibacter sp. SYSU D01012]
MPETTYSLPYSTARRASFGALLSQTMFLVAIAIAFLVVGSQVGQDLTRGAAMGCTIGAIVLLLAQNFVGALRTGAAGMGVLFIVALLMGLGLGPVLQAYSVAQPDAVTNAAITTGLVVAAAGAVGALTAKDLSGWMRPLSFLLLGAVAVSWVMLVFGGGGGVAGDAVSLAIGAFSAVAIVVYFNVLRLQATEDDVIWLATGIFVAIVNIFLTLLNLFTND